MLHVGRWTFGPAQRRRCITTPIHIWNALAAGQTSNVQHPTCSVEIIGRKSHAKTQRRKEEGFSLRLCVTPKSPLGAVTGIISTRHFQRSTSDEDALFSYPFGSGGERGIRTLDTVTRMTL